MHRLIGYDTPFQFMQRRAKTDLEIAGTEIAAGEAVWIILGLPIVIQRAFLTPIAWIFIVATVVRLPLELESISVQVPISFVFRDRLPLMLSSIG